MSHSPFLTYSLTVLSVWINKLNWYRRKVKRPLLKPHTLYAHVSAGLMKSRLCMYSDPGRSGSTAYNLIRPLWQPSSLVRSSPTECQRGGMMMYFSDASVFHLLTLLFFSFASVSIFCPSDGDVVSPVRAGQSNC